MAHPLLLVVSVLLADAWEPTSAYEPREIEHYPVLVNKRLLSQQPELAAEALAVLRVKLFEVNRAVPAKPRAHLHTVRIWLELDDDKRDPCASYHVSAGWLRANGFNPEKERCVEISNARTFLNWIRHQPSMILHELAHAYHHQVLGYDEPRIVELHKQAVASGRYDDVLKHNGRTGKHYALTSPMEYFAESTEAYFGTNDFYPFVRPELRRHDPEMFRLLGLIWGDQP